MCGIKENFVVRCIDDKSIEYVIEINYNSDGIDFATINSLYFWIVSCAGRCRPNNYCKKNT